MSAQNIYEHAPMGAIISYSDGTPRPPDRHRKKLVDWERCNGIGKLICKQPETHLGAMIIPAAFTLLESSFGSRSTMIVRVQRTFSIDTKLTFSIAHRPTPGSIRVMDRAGDGAELVHMTSDRRAAEEWLKRHGYFNAVLDEVPEEGSAGS